MSPLDLIKNALILALQTGTRCICVENVAYQASLLFWFDYVCTHFELSGFDFVPVNPQGRAKNGRIKNMLKGLVQLNPAREVEQYLGPQPRSFVIHEIQNWNPLQPKNKDEAMDLLAYTPQVLLQYSDLIQTEFTLESDSVVSAQVLPSFMTSPF